MGIEQIRKSLGVPARRGGRVRYTGSGKVQYGTIKSAKYASHNKRVKYSFQK